MNNRNNRDQGERRPLHFAADPNEGKELLSMSGGSRNREYQQDDIFRKNKKNNNRQGNQLLNMPLDISQSFGDFDKDFNLEGEF